MKNALVLFYVGLLATVCASAMVIVEHAGSANPTTEGFSYQSGFNTGNGQPVTNDLGLGINAWNINGEWCCSGPAFVLNAADETALTTNNWVLSVYMRDLSTTSSGSFGPDSYGGVVTIGVGGLRFAIDLHSDGHGDQILAADPFVAGPTYTIAGLGANYASIQIAYNATTKTADYYVNGTKVISGFAGFTNFYEPWVGFGGEDSNFNLIELDSDTSISTSAPEPASYALFGLGTLFLSKLFRRKR